MIISCFIVFFVVFFFLAREPQQRVICFVFLVGLVEGHFGVIFIGVIVAVCFFGLFCFSVSISWGCVFSKGTSIATECNRE